MLSLNLYIALHCSFDDEVWEVRIHFEGVDNLERKIGRDDITFMNVLALIETQGYSIRDSIYCRKGVGLELVANNAKIYELLDYFNSSKVLNLIVKRGRAAASIILSQASLAAPASTIPSQASSPASASIIQYRPLVVYDLTGPPVYVVDDEGFVVESEGGTVGSQTEANPYVCTQESINVDKGKAVEEPYDEDNGSGSDFDMGEADFAIREEMRSKEDEELAEKLEEMRRSREDPLLHCEGDTDIEDIFVEEDDQANEPTPEPITEPKKKRNKKVRPGPTTRSHSGVVIDDILNYIPSSDQEEGGFLKEEDDDGFQPLFWVVPKRGKSRAKKMPPRNWYDERRLQPHEQLCLKMCFRDVEQFRNAMINLHIAQSRNYIYHRNSNVRVTVQCIHEDCPFHMVASEIKGEKTFCIRKMIIEHTCGTTTDSSRVSAKWLAHTFESMFRSDPATNIVSLIDAARQQFGVEITKMMAYRAKNLALDAVLGDHRQQYVRLRDFAQTVIDTNPGSRVIVHTITPAPSEENPHPGPTFHGLFFCLNGPKEGFLKGCRPFIGERQCQYFSMFTFCCPSFYY